MEQVQSGGSAAPRCQHVSRGRASQDPCCCYRLLYILSFLLTFYISTLIDCPVTQRIGSTGRQPASSKRCFWLERATVHRRSGHAQGSPCWRPFNPLDNRPVRNACRITFITPSYDWHLLAAKLTIVTSPPSL